MGDVHLSGMANLNYKQDKVLPESNIIDDNTFEKGRKVSSILFATIKYGKITFAKLANSLKSK